MKEVHDAHSDVPNDASEAAFYIAATGSPARPRRTLKHNDTFAIFDSHGDIGASAGGVDGLFDCDTRYLSQLELLIDGAQLLLLHSAIKDDNLNYHVDLTNPDLYAEGRLRLAKDTLHVSRVIYLCDGSLRERLCLTNHGAGPVDLTLSVTFASDFADIFEVRGMRRAKRGSAAASVVDQHTVILSYRGLDDVVRKTALSFDPEPAALKSGHASYAIRLEPHGRQTIFITAATRGRVPLAKATFFRGLLQLDRRLRRSKHDAAVITTANSQLNAILSRSAADLAMLVTETAQGPFPYAGIPWYSTSFGRDAIITALFMLPLEPRIAAGVLRRLARLQAHEEDPKADSSPGKIIHELRGGEMAGLGEIPFGCYYGSVDATPLFVMLAGRYAERTGDLALIKEIWPAIDRALTWIDGAGDPDGDGFIEYARADEAGLLNQGWKDSSDCIFHDDGRLAAGPIALVEVQGYAYAARLAAAALASQLGENARADGLKAAAERLRQSFEEAFWCPGFNGYALALDGKKQQCRVRTSNAGHALFCGIASRERAGHVARALLTEPYFSGWGIRTVARGEARYNPMSYHNGSVWPHDNGIIALGLASYGYRREIAPLLGALVRATTYMDLGRTPELYCGFARRQGRGPVSYPVACAPQAWAAAAPFAMIQAMLGLTFDARDRRIRLVAPFVPRVAGEIVVRNLALGGATVDFLVRHNASGPLIEVLRADAGVDILLTQDTGAPRI